MRGARGFFLLLSALASALLCFAFVAEASLFLLLDPNVLLEVMALKPEMYLQARSAFVTTFKASALSTALLVLTGVPLAYILARKNFRGKSIVEGLIDVPLTVPHTVAGIMILCAYGQRGLLGPLMKATSLRVEDSFWGIVAAMAFVSVPLMVDTSKAGFEAVDPSLEAVARCLGASPARVFFTVSLPLALRSILAGAILAWARALSEVGAILIVAYYPKTVNVLVLEWFNTYGLKYAVALSVPLVVLAAVLFTALRVLVRMR